MKIGILTSSRADFGIYIPLVKICLENKNIDLHVIAFGSHLSNKHGYTIDEIKKYTSKIHALKTPLVNNDSKDISSNIGKTISKFSTFWNENNFDCIFALGDRYEMFAAVTAASPFNLNIAHIHAGETTLGAIDNMYRHAISLMSKILLVSTNEYKKVAEKINTEAKVYNVGALSIDNLKTQKLLSKKDFLEKFNINLHQPTILSTFHPETVDLEKNIKYTNEFLKSILHLSSKYQIVITLPNADTMGDYIRKEIFKFAKNKKNIIIVESFGMIGYLSCMKYCKFMIGNTSSGFVEAAFFPKWVINLGNRQKGRLLTDNIISVPFSSKKIIEAVKKIELNNKILTNQNIYGKGNAAQLIIEKITSSHGI
jgi:GDP/UDP-N,N'-diacetylbacillosamine 2-epimerase (hydrolysing)